ncbi:MAG: radical SAM protein [Thermoproteaceae archaeon]|nr:radical SAM protein [Thermoproteaceae archaeon]
MFFDVTALGLLYTYKCNFSCSHCSIGAGPHHSEVLPTEYIEKVIREASEIATIQVIAITGREPTLLPKHLELAIKTAHDYGFTVRLITNAWWAGTLERARASVRKWASLGLEELNVSYDDFHAEFLSMCGGENNVLNAVKAALEEGLRVAIAVTKTLSSRITGEYVRERLSDLSGDVLIIEDFISPTSRASVLYDKASMRAPLVGGCAYAGAEISVHPNGDVAFCCGHIIADPASGWFTRVGNIKREHLWDVVDRIRRNALIWYLRLLGPHALVRKFNEGEGVKHMCHACHLLATKYWGALAALGKGDCSAI